MTGSREGLDENYWLLEQEANQFITATLLQLAQLKLERQMHSKAVREFSQAINSILKAYQKRSISYEQAKQLFKNLKLGFIDGVRAIKTSQRHRKIRGQQRPSQDGSYRRNMTVNNQSFNVRFKARCATSECLMRGSNFDLQDDAFQEYVEASLQDKRSDVMTVVNYALVANPYSQFLIWLANVDTAVTIAYDDNYSPLAAYALGKGAAYRLKLLGVPAPVRDRIESAISYTSGEFLDENFPRQ
ncbi:hypothetical protein F0225_00015 [Vibrio pectenicida]|uniref:Uncharacterized protein n=1 Tax=Vibrio pectenicida TaxID=62763 RepID=A0A7Y4ECS5_9VIBR|nr:hypothetical protein [Vibrio pectenicida]NOH69726.1 hypothetical protein [Vibrio pectenicida]